MHKQKRQETRETPHTRSREALPQGVWVLVGAAFLIAIGYGLITPVLPQYAHSFGVSVMAASAIVLSLIHI